MPTPVCQMIKKARISKR